MMSKETYNKYLKADKKVLVNVIVSLNDTIDKAIEYLEKKSKELEWWDTDFMMCISILKGEDNE